MLPLPHFACDLTCLRDQPPDCQRATRTAPTPGVEPRPPQVPPTGRWPGGEAVRQDGPAPRPAGAAIGERADDRARPRARAGLAVDRSIVRACRRVNPRGEPA